ncbi:hypothetical protein GQ457_10G000840 [Hibiscus cannabinus]
MEASLAALNISDGWLLEQDCEEIIQQFWNSSTDPLPKKLENLGKELQSWGSLKRKRRRESKAVLESRLHALEDDDPDDDNLAELIEVKLGLNIEADKEERFWEQRSRVNWLLKGDKNTSFFHNFASTRRKTNNIAEIVGTDGNVVSSLDGILNTTSSFFGDLFTAESVSETELIFEKVTSSITTELNRVLTAPFKAEEVSVALRTMSPLKAPGLDGFPVLFYQTFWDIVGAEVTNFCLSVLNEDNDMTYINQTHIVLIPKVKVPRFMSQFRPISLCNVLYKLVAKMLVLRMKNTLSCCIDEAQGAFVPGRQISDNVLVAYEILHSLKTRRTGARGTFALKLDMSKAYDRVEWVFLEGMMRRIGFHDNWISLIMKCVTTVSYSVGVNGASSAIFLPTRGLRQGDPLSPYLFLFYTEGFSTLLYAAQNAGLVNGATIGRERLAINHLFFADDSILFGDASIEGAANIQKVISTYSNASGQKVNFDKSLIYFSSNVTSSVRDSISTLLGVRVSVNPEKYLGLPTMVGRRKNDAFKHYFDRFYKLVDNWNTKNLSKGGKEVFIKSVLQSIPVYTMQCFLLPRGVCVKLETIMNKFWWRNSGSSKGIHWCTWLRMCLPKRLGGMGFKDLSKFNVALLAKQGWRILTNPTCLLARVLKARYYPISNFMHATLGSSPSYTWRSIYSARGLLETGLGWKVGTGLDISVWNDAWLPGKGNGRLNLPIDIRFPKVSDLIIPETNVWNYGLLQSIFPSDIADRIGCIPLARSKPCDELIWRYENTGLYSPKSGYKLLLEMSSSQHPINAEPSDTTMSSKRDQSLIAISYWALWYARNEIVHESRPFSAVRVSSFILSFLLELDSSIVVPASISLVKDVKWFPPDGSLIKLNFDASFNSVSNSSVSGIVARDSHGFIMAACTCPHRGIADAFIAEAVACEKAVSFALDLGFRSVQIEGDSLSVIKKLNSKEMDKSIISPIIGDIKVLCANFVSVTFSFVGRRGNAVAHELA